MTLIKDPLHDQYPTRLEQLGEWISRSHPTVWGSVEDGPFTADELSNHEAQGFSIIDDFISPDDVASYRRELERLSADERLKQDPRIITEKKTGALRSVFDVAQLRDPIAALASHPSVLNRARQLLGSEVYLHQTRVNYMPGFTGTGFYWHSDFETWHAEDGMPIPRAVSVSIALSDNFPYNGGLMVMPGSHKFFVPSVGATPEGNHKQSLKEQAVGVPSHDTITDLAERLGIKQFTGGAGSALWFDANIMHGSGNNITPYPRSNVFMVFNSVENTLTEPYSAKKPRPDYIASRDFTPLG